MLKVVVMDYKDIIILNFQFINKHFYYVCVKAVNLLSQGEEKKIIDLSRLIVKIN
ncbi:hypothetical protein TTHERM_000287959 (macronuclear) [Tetrahymena thermophila SB210]|uniref:Uncharacterized protein n=1 Tax=Tetrahymena thermophila (strain SB210) TaxID=312017 RepID=W7X378_TETTS|nr:hypothetical protein TTHERM_000287959 [Tetrahymena thermophila SB210]EWS73750.1 hypothetical protein TTHERM_000287959 [Tetrahymena thermophila SB210]|eukprot:XP_012653714.1 hypothetical protein TTHERM_000287959 [Tetrahymena thermophila SB210]